MALNMADVRRSSERNPKSEGRKRANVRSAYSDFGFRPVCGLWISDFGFASGFGLFLRNRLAGSAFGLDFGFGGSAESVGADGQFLGQLAVAEDFDTIGAAVGQAGGAQGGFIDAAAIVEAVKGFEVDGEEAGSMPGVVETTLRDAPNERHLAAFEPDTDRTAGTCGLALAAATGGFTVAGGFALTEAFAAVLGTGTGLKIM
jgi:hypothetical protein